MAVTSRTCATCRLIYDIPEGHASHPCPACGTVNAAKQEGTQKLEALLAELLALAGDKAAAVSAPAPEAPARQPEAPARQPKTPAPTPAQPVPRGPRTAFHTVPAAEGCMIDDCRSDADCICVPEALGGETVTAIGPRAFSGCRRLRELRLPASLRTLADGAFAHCKRLKRLRLPEGTQEIGACAFSGCTALEELVIPASVKEIGEYAFMGCIRLTLTVTEDSAAQAYARRHGVRFRVAGPRLPVKREGGHFPHGAEEE